jgi:hypothetical protein
MRIAASFVAVALLAGCVSPIPFGTVTLPDQPTVTSHKTAKIELVTGAVAGSGSNTFVPMGTVVVPMSSGPVPSLQFQSGDQREFVDVLRSELLRLKVFRDVAASSDKAADITIRINFAHTYHQVQNHEYTLDVVMQLSGGIEPLVRQYRVNSNEDASFWERINTNAYEGKAKAVRKLLEKVVPDVQAYVKANAVVSRRSPREG